MNESAEGQEVESVGSASTRRVTRALHGEAVATLGDGATLHAIRAEAGRRGGKTRALQGRKEQPQLAVKRGVAANMRASGRTWKEVARALHYSSGDSARKCLVEQNVDAWMEVYLAALDSVLRQEVEPETIAALRQIIREAKDSKDSKTVKNAQAAGHTLLLHCGRLRTARIELLSKKQIQADSELIDELKGGVNETTRKILELLRMPKIVSKLPD